MRKMFESYKWKAKVIKLLAEFKGLINLLLLDLHIDKQEILRPFKQISRT